MQHQNFIADQKPQDQIVHLSLATCIPEEVVPPVEEPEEIEKEEPVPEKIIPEPIEPKIIPKPVIEEIKKEPIEKKKIVKKKKVKKKVKRRVVAKITKGLKRTCVSSNSTAKRNQFLAKVRKKINQYKSYPKIAKRRGMQGTVKVRFTILASGHLGHISVTGPKVFHNSARNAVKNAFPISTKNVPISLPQSVNLTLCYQFK